MPIRSWDIVIGALIGALQYVVSALGYALPSGFFTASMISIVQSVYGNATPPPAAPLNSGTCNAFNFWGFVFAAAGVVTGLGSFSAALLLPFKTWQSVTFMAPYLSFIFGVMSIFLAVYSLLGGAPNFYVSAFSLGLGVASLLLYGIAYLNKASYMSSTRSILGPMGYIDLGVGLVGTGLSAGALAESC